MYTRGLGDLSPLPPLEVDLSSGAPASPWADALKSTAQAWGTWQQTSTMRQLQQINIDRARAGLPPINTSQYQSGVPIQLDAQTQSTINLAVIGALAIGVLWLLKS
jgi:hypothetical protein